MDTAADRLGRRRMAAVPTASAQISTQPGVGHGGAYLGSLPRPINPRCEAGHYYLLNNYNPGYFGNGSNAYTDLNAANTVFTIPPSSAPSIGDTMLKKNISWKYYGDQWNNYVTDQYQLNYGVLGPTSDELLQHLQPVSVRHVDHGE